MSDSVLMRLDESSPLFCRTLSSIHQTRNYDTAINKWAGGAHGDSGLALSTSSHVKTDSARHSSHSKPRVLPLTSRPTSTPSVRGEIISHGSADVQDEEASEKSAVISDGGLSDYNETNGTEWLAAVNSPIKGKKRVSSEVCPLHSLHYI